LTIPSKLNKINKQMIFNIYTLNYITKNSKKIPKLKFVPKNFVTEAAGSAIFIIITIKACFFNYFNMVSKVTIT